MRKLILIALVLMACIVPAMASDFGSGTIEVSAPDGHSIANLYIVSNEGTTGTIVFQHQNGMTTGAAWSYTTVADLYGYSIVRRGAIAIGSEFETRDYVTPGQLYTMFYQVPGVANITQNRFSGFMDQSKVSLWPTVEADGPASPVIKVTITSDAEIEYWYDYVDTSEQQGLLASSNDDWIKKIMEFAYGSFWLVYDFVTMLLYWLRFFFVDNLLLIIALFLSVPMAFAAKNSKGNPEKFFRQYFKSLRGFFEFMLSMWRMLIETIGTVRGWFRI